jgi:hypothetical protein
MEVSLLDLKLALPGLSRLINPMWFRASFLMGNQVEKTGEEALLPFCVFSFVTFSQLSSVFVFEISGFVIEKLLHQLSP